MDKQKEDIVAGNFEIARFDGYTYPDINNEAFRVSLDLHNYHEDWNKLMRVVDKIETSADPVTGHMTVIIQDQMCEIIFGSIQKRAYCADGSIPKIQVVWTAVVQFIKWYNSQPETK